MEMFSIWKMKRNFLRCPIICLQPQSVVKPIWIPSVLIPILYSSEVVTLSFVWRNHDNTEQNTAKHMNLSWCLMFINEAAGMRAEIFNISLSSCSYGTGHSIQRVVLRRALQFTFTYQVQGKSNELEYNSNELEHNWTQALKSPIPQYFSWKRK